MGACQLEPDRLIHEAISELNSLVGSEFAVEKVVALGKLVIPHLEHLLLDGPPRTISIPRCRAVRALGELGAYSILLKYFLQYECPVDSAVLFAEDAVRSAAAKELAQVRSEEVYQVLLAAAKERATGGMVQALGAFRRCESIPLLFELLEDDFCRIDALTELRKVPDAAQPYAILLLRGCTNLPIQDSNALRRRRSTLQLLSDFGISERDWPEIQAYLHDEDLDCVIAAARIGFSLAAEEGATERIVVALLEGAPRMNWAQEMETMELLDQRSSLIRTIAKEFVSSRIEHEAKPNWLSPLWRILHHVLGHELQHDR